MYWYGHVPNWKGLVSYGISRAQGLAIFLSQDFPSSHSYEQNDKTLGQDVAYDNDPLENISIHKMCHAKLLSKVSCTKLFFLKETRKNINAN